MSKMSLLALKRHSMQFVFGHLTKLGYTKPQLTDQIFGCEQETGLETFRAAPPTSTCVILEFLRFF